MLRILESQAPAKQTATDTINTLSSRLSSATLLEDRRAAILGLRSFAKQYPASVASGALRDLIAALRRDGEDSDTIKVVLETLLMLFEPDETSPEASEEITLWLADEFTQRQDNVTALLDLLDTSEFYLRLYSLQLLSHISAHRPQRAQEVVLAAPLGVSRIAAILDDRREAVRNEALLLLVALTPSSTELQKVVAFENAFDRVLALIETEGGITHGSTTVQDCLSLLANLLKLNPSNQSYFREIGCIAKVSKLLAEVLREEESAEGVSDWIRTQRDINLWGMLRILQLFLVPGLPGTTLSQTIFWQQRVLLRILQVAFHQSFGINVRAQSLDVCGDMIRRNASLQEQFGDLSVPLPKPKAVTANGHASPGPTDKRSAGRGSTTATPIPSEPTNVIEALLELTLEPASLTIFDVRIAACNCLKAFFEGHAGIRSHVLRRAIEGHSSGADTIPNILTVLLEPTGLRSNSDPYQVWMASVLLLHILYDDSDTKTMALKILEGRAEEGEEVVTFVQSLTSNVVAGAQYVEDERALLGYLMLLCTWLFEDSDAVNDFLGESSNLNGLVAAVKVSSPTMPLVAGLCCLLLGIVYEFSTKDSPISRAAVQGVLRNQLGFEVYSDRLMKLRESPFVRLFGFAPNNADGPLPQIYFDKTFIDFLQDNTSRFLRAINRDPKFEAAFTTNGVQKGISRELVDNLQAQIGTQNRQLELSQSETIQLKHKLEQEELAHRRTRDSTSVELTRIRHINDSLHQNHEEEVNKIQREARRQHEAQVKEIEQQSVSHTRELRRIQDELTRNHQDVMEQITSEAMREQQRLRGEVQRLQSQVEDVRSQLSEQADAHQRQLQKLSIEHTHRISELESQIHTTDSKRKSVEVQSSDLQAQLKAARTSLLQAEDRASASQKSLDELNTTLNAQVVKTKDVQSELDDLLVVFADLEAKHVAGKKRLKELGEEVSEDEDEDDDDVSGEDDDDEEQEEDDKTEEDEEEEGGGDEEDKKKK